MHGVTIACPDGRGAQAPIRRTGGRVLTTLFARAPRSFALVIAAALGLTGCSGTPGAPPTPQPTTPRPRVTFTAELTATPESLTWEYSLRNDGTTAVAVFNGPDRAAPDDDPPVWVVNAGGGRVEVSQRLHDLPEGVLAAEPYYVGGSTLEPGESLTGRASVALPLRLHYPYASVADEGYAPPDDPKDVIFCLGVMERPAGAEPVEWFAHDAWATGMQHRVCSEPHPLN